VDSATPDIKMIECDIPGSKEKGKVAYLALRWLVIPGLLDGKHIFTIEPLGVKRVRFIQREILTGLLVPIFMRFLEMNTRRGFEEMNKALKVRAEQIAPYVGTSNSFVVI
jgi:hypothetical protein